MGIDRVVTRPDFDGIVSASLLKRALEIEEAVYWVEPYELPKRQSDIGPSDVIANLPFLPGCGMWFDHHATNAAQAEAHAYEGEFRLTPSAARIIYDRYRSELNASVAQKGGPDFARLTAATDRIDAAELTPDEVKYPRRNPHSLLSLTISGKNRNDAPYWNMLVDELAKREVEQVLKFSEVSRRVKRAIKANQNYRRALRQYTEMRGAVSLTDFRERRRPPSGSRFLVYSLYPDGIYNLKVRYDHNDPERVVFSIGSNIFRPGEAGVHIGSLASEYGGGGHAGAGAFSVAEEEADQTLVKVLEQLNDG
jgi:hypothetical protein